MARRFLPKYGSGYTPFFTSAPTTVAGTRAACQPRGTKLPVEISAPLCGVWAEDWISHSLSLRSIREGFALVWRLFALGAVSARGPSAIMKNGALKVSLLHLY